jgi:small-conductance mechanosensitive channel
MNESWWWAAAFIASGLVVGTFAGVTVRRLLQRPGQRLAVTQAARPAAAFVFWIFVASGLIAAVASASPDTLEPIPSDLLAWLPRAGIAGLILIAGYVLATIASAGVSRTAARASGSRQPLLDSATRASVLGASIVLALTQLGVDTTILNILVAALAGGVVVALAGIAIIGGRDIARSVAAGKALAPHLEPGTRLTMAGHTGELTQLTATHAVISLDDGDLAVLPLTLAGASAVIVHSTR